MIMLDSIVIFDISHIAGVVHVPLLLGLHRGDQQLPGPGGLRVRQHQQLRLGRGAGRYINVSRKLTYL